MDVLVLGAGAREHALAWWLAFQLRFDFDVPENFRDGLWTTVVIVVAIKRAKKNPLGATGKERINSRSRARKNVDSAATKLLNNSIDRKVSKIINSN